MLPVPLEEIVDHLDMIMDEWATYLNKKTGRICVILKRHMAEAEDYEDDNDLEEYSEEEKEAIKEAMVVVENWTDIVTLPDKEDVHEYSIIEDFSYATPDPVKRAKLCRAIQGRGAFRRFKDEVSYLGLEEAYYAYRLICLSKIAEEWCKDNGIPYISAEAQEQADRLP